MPPPRDNTKDTAEKQAESKKTCTGGRNRVKKRALAALLALLLACAGPECQVAAAPMQDCPPAVALTFDDGPNGACTEALLRLLAEKDVPATFFLCGYRIAEQPDLAAAIADAGHEIGLHGYSHEYFTKMTPEALAQELAQTAALLQDAGAGETALLRPPGGLVSDEVRCQAAQAGLSLIFWNVDPEDWRGGPAQATAQHVISHVAPGAIVLLHDLQGTSVTAAGQIIDALQAQGYQFLTVSQLAAYYGKALTPGESYRAFSPQEPPCGPAG